MPAQRGTLDASGKRMNARQRGKVADLVGGMSSGNDVVEFLIQLLGFRAGFALDLRRHDRSARLRDRTAGTVEGNFRDTISLHPQKHVALISTRGVLTMRDPIGGRKAASISRAFIVIEDHMLI